MRGGDPLGRGSPEGTYYTALKAEAEVVEGRLNDLLFDVYLFSYALQRVIDSMWELERPLSRGEAHDLYYDLLRSYYGFRAHVARNIYNIAYALVKTARTNNGSKPTVKSVFARLDRYDARVDLTSMVVRVNLRGKWYTLKLRHRPEYVARFAGLEWKEVHLSWKGGKLFVSIVFVGRYKPHRPRGVLALDVNLRQLVLYDGERFRRIRTRFIDALSLRAHAERLQKKYRRTWRRNRRVLARISSLHRRSRNIVLDWSRKTAKTIVETARRRRLAIALEDLDRLRDEVHRSGSRVRWLLELFAYRKLLAAIESKATQMSVPVVKVDPRGTSRTCPRCGTELVYVRRLGYCRNCGLVMDRDSIAAINIHAKALNHLGYVGEPGSPPNTPAMTNETRASGGNKMSQ